MVKEPLQPNDWLTIIDLNDAYFTYSRDTSKVSQIHSRESKLSIHKLSIWYVKHLMVLYQDSQTGGSHAQIARGKVGTYLDNILIMADMPRVALDHTCLLTLPVGESQLSGTSREVIYHPGTEC